jgi:mannose-1-phosphate guanylyltransferase/mannose-1-phosphate guanylyltransferase/phosphomannomutase
MRVARRDSVEGAAGVVVLGADGRVVGYQLRPNPAEALSDLVDVEDYEVDDEALEYLPEGATFGPEAIPALLEQDVPVYAVGP